MTEQTFGELLLTLPGDSVKFAGLPERRTIYARTEGLILCGQWPVPGAWPLTSNGDLRPAAPRSIAYVETMSKKASPFDTHTLDLIMIFLDGRARVPCTFSRDEQLRSFIVSAIHSIRDGVTSWVGDATALDVERVYFIGARP